MPPPEYKLRVKLGRLREYLCSQKESTDAGQLRQYVRDSQVLVKFDCDRISSGCMQNSAVDVRLR